MILTTNWLNSLFEKTPEAAWEELLSRIKNELPTEYSDIKGHYRQIEEKIALLDRVLQSSAWDMWANFGQAPKGSQIVKDFWAKTIGPKAVLILDSLSMREVAPILAQLKNSKSELVSINFAGSEVPSETEIYANALGLPGRFSLKKKPLPGGFVISTQDTFVDTFKKIPFPETVSKLSNDKNLFVWHGWPDDTLHDQAAVEDAFNRFIDIVKESIDSDGFRSLIMTMARGRELLITSDHGYCNTSSFTPAQGEQQRELSQLGHTRAKKITAEERVEGMTIPPATMNMTASANRDLYKLAIGRWRPANAGFPALTHGGLSLMECVVPLIHIRGVSNG